MLSNAVAIAKKDDYERIVFGMVYAPDLLDAHGDMMTAEEIKKACYDYMRTNMSVDTNHDEWATDCYPVECYIAKANDPDGYIEGAWVMGVKIVDDDLWEKVLKGEIAGFSIGGTAIPKLVLTEYEYYPSIVGFTAPHPEDGHVHAFFVKVDEDGKVTAGETSEVNGHSHKILKGTATAISDDHQHRINIKQVSSEG